MRFDTEEKSIQFIVKRLQAKGWTDIKATQAKDPTCYYDIEATNKDGKICRFELKRRYKNYGDHLMENSKYNKMIKAMENGECDACRLISFFDDYFVASDVRKWYAKEWKQCPQTTDFGRTDYVWKLCVMYHQDKKYNYDERID